MSISEFLFKIKINQAPQPSHRVLNVMHPSQLKIFWGNLTGCNSQPVIDMRLDSNKLAPSRIHRAIVF